MDRHGLILNDERKRRREYKLHNLLSSLKGDLTMFTKEYYSFVFFGATKGFGRFQRGKGVFVTSLYRQRGKMAKRLMHSCMAGIAAFGVMVAPIIAEEFPGSGIDPWEAPSPSSVLSMSTESDVTETMIADKDHRFETIEYEVKDGDTVSSIAQKFGITTDTIRWENSLASKDSIKIGQVLKILPVVGV